MKFAVVICVLCSLIVINEAAIATARFHNPSNPGKCTLEEDYILGPGEKGKAPNHPCAGVTCMDDGYVEFKTCPAVAPPKGCKLRYFKDTSLSYPDCCERIHDCTPKI